MGLLGPATSLGMSFLSVMYTIMTSEIDDTAALDLYHYCLTLTCRDTFTQEQEDLIVAWHRERSDKCLLTREPHGDGRPHYHSLIAVVKPSTANAVNKSLTTLYKKMNIEIVKGISFFTKRMTDKVGQFHYQLEDCKDSVVIFLRGWTMSWIKQQCKDGIKKIPHKLLAGSTYMVQKRTSVELVLRFAKASGLPLTGKTSFIMCVYKMQQDGFQFDNVSKGDLYSNVMARMGVGEESRSVWVMALLPYD